MNKSWCWQKFLPVPATAVTSRYTSRSVSGNLAIAVLFAGDPRHFDWGFEYVESVQEAIHPHVLWGLWCDCLPVDHSDPSESDDYRRAYWLDSFRSYFDRSNNRG